MANSTDAPRPAPRPEEVSAHLQELVVKHKVPGASLAFSLADTTVAAAAGVVNLATGVEATPDTIFQIGSITKVWTATLVMQLVDEGLVDLDAPVRKYLPELELSDPAAADDLLVRHLLTHTSGIDGDAFDEFGRGDECIERYVNNLPNLAQQGRPGARFSYCNAGFVVLGRILETLRGASWDAVLRDHLISPLGLTRTCSLPEEAILRRAAIGHLPTGTDGDDLQPAPVWSMTRAMGPAGASLAATASELVGFARMHHRGGVAPDGTRVLSAESVAAMQVPRVPLPGILGRSVGVSWLIEDWGGQTVIGHNGGTIGQAAFMRLFPETGFAIALLTNGGGAASLFYDLVGEISEQVAGVRPPALPSPPDPEVSYDPDRFAGVYERAGIRFVLDRHDDGYLWVTAEHSGPLAAVLGAEPEAKKLVGLDETTLIGLEPEQGMHMPYEFMDFDGSGRPSILHMGGRATPRVG